MKAMENRSFDWNSVRLQIPSFDKQQSRAMSSFDIPVRHTPQDSLSSPDSEEESILKAVDEEEQPLLSLDQPNGGALQNSKVTGGCTRIERVPRLVLPQKKRTRSLSGLVASNDFFIPCPLSPTSVYPPPSCTGRDTTISQTPRALMTPRTPRTDRMTPRTLRTPRYDLMTPRTPRKEVLADSLRGQFTPRNSTKGGGDLGRRGNWAGGFLGRAIRGRERYPGNRLQTPRGSYQSATNATNCGMTTDLEKKLQEQGLTPMYCPEPRCEQRRLGNVASMITDLRVFLIRPVPEDYGPTECYIRRHVHAKWLTPSYRLYLSDGDRFLLSSKKRKKTKTNYTISLDENDTSKQSGNYFGKLRSNFIGSEYWFYDKGTPPIQAAGCGTLRLPTSKNRVEMGAVKYHVNVLGIAGPRKMTAIIPSLQEDGKPHVFPPAADGGPVILDDYKCGQHRDKMIIMHNKQPHFNKQLAAYCLNFNGRVTKPSVRNFQLVADSDPDIVILQFGKIGRNLFTMDYQHPMSALQAFSICLSSLDPKLACE
ncbi:hypothetical protein M758_1G049200 [Ceratodon purpureus]|nr:hypothetical protein M758_1G049200 [Ceratodon purpureus]